MNFSFTFYDEHYKQIKDHLLRDDGRERVAFIICGKSEIDTSTPEKRFLSMEVIVLSDDQLMDSNQVGVSWNNNFFIDALKKSEIKNLTIAIIHNHPSHYRQFSSVDDEGEYHLFKLAFNRNESEFPYASLIMMPDGSVIGRAWTNNLNNHPIQLIRVIGDRIQLFYDRKDNFQSPEFLQRQRLALGSALIEDFSKLRIGIIGCGATGSATAMLLTRLGIKDLILIDDDAVEETNLNRLHGASRSDILKNKVDVLRSSIEELGLGTKVTALKGWVTSKAFQNNIKSCDLIFGCTDDNSGRVLLNRLAYFYFIPVIDMGLHIALVSNESKIKTVQGRVTFVFPGRNCLLTRGVINLDLAYSESIKRRDVNEFNRLKEEAYVVGEGNPNPAVITFTTEVATIAVNEFLNRMTGFNLSGPIDHRLRQFHQDIDLFPADKEEFECRICGSKNYWGRGDMIPFLDISS